MTSPSCTMPAMEATEASRPLLKRVEILEAAFEDAMMYAVDAYCVAGSYKKCPHDWPSVEDCESCWRRHMLVEAAKTVRRRRTGRDKKEGLHGIVC
ncbi:MAG: hypothetical protein K6E40_15860 [Desulfovibrio sp.]|nr:hypothetical protein [Desulfovibrio sp.]